MKVFDALDDLPVPFCTFPALNQLLHLKILGVLALLRSVLHCVHALDVRCVVDVLLIRTALIHGTSDVPVPIVRYWLFQRRREDFLD